MTEKGKTVDSRVSLASATQTVLPGHPPERGRLFRILILSQAFCLTWIFVNLLAFGAAWRLARPVSMTLIWGVEEMAGQAGLRTGDDHTFLGLALFLSLFLLIVLWVQWLTLSLSLLAVKWLQIPAGRWPFDLERLPTIRRVVLLTVGLLAFLLASFFQPWLPGGRCVYCGYIPVAIVGGLFGAFSAPLLLWWLRSPKRKRPSGIRTLASGQSGDHI